MLPLWPQPSRMGLSLYTMLLLSMKFQTGSSSGGGESPTYVLPLDTFNSPVGGFLSADTAVNPFHPMAPFAYPGYRNIAGPYGTNPAHLGAAAAAAAGAPPPPGAFPRAPLPSSAVSVGSNKPLKPAFPQFLETESASTKGVQAIKGRKGDKKKHDTAAAAAVSAFANMYGIEADAAAKLAKEGGNTVFVAPAGMMMAPPPMMPMGAFPPPPPGMMPMGNVNLAPEGVENMNEKEGTAKKHHKSPNAPKLIPVAFMPPPPGFPMPISWPGLAPGAPPSFFSQAAENGSPSSKNYWLLPRYYAAANGGAPQAVVMEEPQQQNAEGSGNQKQLPELTKSASTPSNKNNTDGKPRFRNVHSQVSKEEGKGENHSRDTSESAEASKVAAASASAKSNASAEASPTLLSTSSSSPEGVESSRKSKIALHPHDSVQKG